MTAPQSLVGSIRKKLVPIRLEGFPVVGILVFLALFFGWFWQPVLWIGLILAALSAYFYRDPARVTPLDDGAVVSPADGHVAAVSLGVAPRELDLGEQLRRRVSISLSLLDCHVSRAPSAGTVAKALGLRPDRAERGDAMVVASAHGPIAIVQIAGLPVPRAASFVSEGGVVEAGERIGLLRVGSRIDVYLPVKATVLVAEGQTAVAGETIVASFVAEGAPATRRTRTD
jgi:phosphatidylserine decarboxylase